ncbi:hypothetical protein ADICYQ_4476 [Cyclobacterium qasimii M12-11B]|uniref:Uncharacterized protein n=1 Tax=Cyclobacterium qasimii M12-11B TaxID=641524 RepID=S7V9T8_9BACT|nr:hypothetical protein ADICYQ_4476 [Cyclobacterium qasimii M12-11B]
MVKLKTATIGYFEAISARKRLSIAYFGLKDRVQKPSLIIWLSGHPK